jgi:hypothetical protein
MDTAKTAQKTRTGLSPFFQVPTTSLAYREAVHAENVFWDNCRDEWSGDWESVKTPAGATRVIRKQAPSIQILHKDLPLAQQEPSAVDYWAQATMEWADDSVLGQAIESADHSSLFLRAA